MSPETVDYLKQIEEEVIDWLWKANPEDLIKHGVISRQSAEDAPAGKNASYTDFLALGQIQGDPQLVRLQIACQVCPQVSEKKAIAWIMKMTGGCIDPAKIRAAFRVVRGTMLEATAKDAADAQMLVTMKEARRQAVKNSSHQPEFPPSPEGMTMRLRYDPFSPRAPFVLMQPYTRGTGINPAAYGYTASQTIDVPAGFCTDFASVPRFAWSIIPPMGKHSYAAVVHDYLYWKHPAGRKWADAVFYDLMKADGVGVFTRWICWAAVRIFGRKAWG